MGFRLQYPPNWELTDSGGGLALQPPSPVGMTKEIRNSMDEIWPRFQVQVIENPDKTDPKELFQNFVLPKLNKNIDHHVTETTIAGRQAIKFIDLATYEVQAYILSTPKGDIMEIFFNINPPSEKLKTVFSSDIFDKILSTLIFIR